MTQEKCGICGQAPSEHDLDQIHKCFSDAGFEIEFEIGDALYIAREFKLVKKYSPGARGYPAKVWFKEDPDVMIETDDLPETVFKVALPKLEALEPKKSEAAGPGLDEEHDAVFDDETLARMEEEDEDPSEG